MNIAISVGLVVLAFIIYRKCFRERFVYDDLAVFANEPMRSPSIKVASNGNLRGLVAATFAINWKFVKSEQRHLRCDQTIGFHLTNVAIHAFNGLLVAALFGWWAAIFFIVSPLAVNAVANIIGRFCLMSIMFCLLALLAATYGWWWLFPILFLASLFSKQDTAGLPLQVAAMLFVEGRNDWIYYLLGPVLVVLGVYYCSTKVRGLLNFRTPSVTNITGWPPAPKPIEFAKTFIVDSVKKFPCWFFGWGYNINPHFERKSWGSFTLACLALLISGLLTPFIPHQLVLGLVMLMTSPWWLYVIRPLPDHCLESRAYGSLIGLAIVGGWLATQLPLYVVAVWLTVLAMITYQRAGAWSPFKLFKQAIADGSKRPMILLNESSMLLQTDPIQEAERLAVSVLKEHPTIYHAWANLGTIYALKRDHRRMLFCYRKGAFKCQKLPLAWKVLGDAYGGLGMFSRAMACYRKACLLEPRNIQYIRDLKRVAQLPRLVV